jgi:hypothetical protein
VLGTQDSQGWNEVHQVSLNGIRKISILFLHTLCGEANI